MGVKRCYLCEQDPLEGRRYGDAELAQGADCPICFQSVCRYHLTTVRWRWRESEEVDAALICKECKRTYAHRDWDTFNRDWIS